MTFLAQLKKDRGSLFMGCFANLGAILFGFDAGGIGPFVALQSFKSDFHLSTSASKYADTSGNIVTLLNAGAFFGCLIPPTVGMYYGRRVLLAIAGFFFVVGAVLQVAAVPPSLSMIYAGRTIAGLGVGMISNTAPTFVAECAPKHLRGFLMAAFDLFLIIGALIAYFAVYGCSVHLPPTSAQWRIPISLQVPLGLFVMIAPYFMVESPRWLAKSGHWDKSMTALSKIRLLHPSDPQILEEMAEIRAQIEQELATISGRSVKELFTQGTWQRLLWGVFVTIFTLWCGHSVILYYGPTVFVQIGFTSQNSALLGSGIVLVVKFGAVILFLVIVRFLSRKTFLMSGTFIMGACLFSLGGLLKTHPPGTPGNNSDSASAKAMMAFIYIYMIGYSISWGPLSWVYIGEIFPSRIRDYGMSACTMMFWLMNFVVSKIGPIAIVNIGWKTWMIFGTANIAACIFCFFLPETNNLSLEEMDVLFGAVDESVRKRDIELNLNEKSQAVTTKEI